MSGMPRLYFTTPQLLNMMYVTLMILTILAVLVLVFVLVKYLRGIIASLTSIGGNGQSYLAKLRLGLRAIETETGHLPVEVTKLNGALSETADGLKVVDGNLVGTINAVLKQNKY
jgi:hypothetical protein